jgi:hypothetical protein
MQVQEKPSSNVSMKKTKLWKSTTVHTPHCRITGSLGIIQCDKDGIAFTLIQNCLPYAIWIESNDLMGYAGKIKNRKLNLKN